MGLEENMVAEMVPLVRQMIRLAATALILEGGDPAAALARLEGVREPGDWDRAMFDGGELMAQAIREAAAQTGRPV